MATIALPVFCSAQSAGPRSPATTANDGSVGSTAWSNTGNSVSSNDSYSTVTTKGISNYLKVTDLGFTIPSPSAVSGIQLDVERNSNSSSDVALLDAWSTGLTRSISAGSNRCLIVAYAQENGIDPRDVTAMTYGTRTMTQLTEFSAGVSGGFNARIEVWALLESEIALASNTTIVPTYGSYSAYEYCDVFTAAVFQHVDQINPMSSQQTTGAQASTDPHQLSTAFTTAAGSMAINLATCGNRDASAPAVNSNTSSYATATGYTEGIDYYFANAAAPTSGASFQVIHKAVASAGSEQPSCDFNGTVNRYAIVGFCLQRAREVDYSVKLVKGGTIGGSDLANSTAWPATDAYASYGGSSSLWGRTWTEADINSSSFGAAIATRVQNGIARVDHMRITVWYYSTLPIELLDLRATQEGTGVRIDWITATETDNDHFVVQRSTDGVCICCLASCRVGAQHSWPNRLWVHGSTRRWSGARAERRAGDCRNRQARLQCAGNRIRLTRWPVQRFHAPLEIGQLRAREALRGFELRRNHGDDCCILRRIRSAGHGDLDRALRRCAASAGSDKGERIGTKVVAHRGIGHNRPAGLRRAMRRRSHHRDAGRGEADEQAGRQVKVGRTVHRDRERAGSGRRYRDIERYRQGSSANAVLRAQRDGIRPRHGGRTRNDTAAGIQHKARRQRCRRPGRLDRGAIQHHPLIGRHNLDWSDCRTCSNRDKGRTGDARFVAGLDREGQDLWRTDCQAAGQAVARAHRGREHAAGGSNAADDTGRLVQ